MDKLKNDIDVAMARRKADIVLKNASIINVFTQTIDKGDIAISQDTIIGIGKYEGICEMDCAGLFVTPGFIDAHVHIESSMVTPEIFSQIVIKRGVTTVVADPHEIANVLGNKGIKFMLHNSSYSVIDNYFMLPSCVPAVDFEDNGATLDAKKLAKFCHNPRILGLGEVMDVNAVTSGKKDMLDKIKMIRKLNKTIDGHCPKVNQKELNAYLCAGIKTDHECTDSNEASMKVKNGMYVMMREGSQARDLINLLPAVTKENYHRFLFCTDDRHIEDLIEEGSIDNNIRIAIKEGLDPVMAYTIASLNAAKCYQLHDRGVIAPGMKADLVLLDDLEKCEINKVMKNGKFHDGSNTYSKVKAKNSIHLKKVNTNVFKIKGEGEFVHVIKVNPGSLKTTKVKRNVKNIGKSINKIAVIERHKNTGKYFTGFIEGLSLEKAAIAQTIAHDSHNIIVVGDNDKDMEVAVNRLIDMSGGIVFVSEGMVLEFISLPIAGIMTDENPKEVFIKVKRLNHIARKHGIKEGIDPFITLSFMALPVIPEIKITARGLFDYNRFEFISLFCKDE
ncbi:adenine deaminase [Mycoplasmatota bacterium]|nr:adenine deaminase [Mycoplasmatota bacterium]